MSSTAPADLRARLAEIDAIGAVAIGIIAFVVGYVFTGMAAFVGEWPTQAGGVRGGLIAIGFTFYAAHSVQVGLPGGGSLDFLAGLRQPDVPIFVYYAIPILVLAVSGALAARRTRRRGLDPGGLAATAASIAAGYATMAVLGTFVFTAGTRGGGTARLALSEAAIFGLVYPLVFGAIGVALVQAVDAYRDARPNAGPT